MKLTILSILLCLLSSISVFGHSSIINDELGIAQEFKLVKVAGNVHVLFGSGGNIGVSYGDDGLLTIDTQFSRFVPQIKAELAKLGNDKPKFVFNTHYHGDHTGGNALFGADAFIIAHQNVLERLMSKVDREGKPQEPMAKAGLPSITYYEGLSLYMNGERIKAVHFPKGHTDGDTVIFFTGSNVVHLGDDFFAGRFPFVDLNSGGSVQGLTMNIGKLIQMIPADAKLIPGHGPVSTIDDLRKYHEMLVETTLAVRGHMKAGKNYEEVKKAGLPEKYKSWSPEGSFINEERWIETIYKSYEMKMTEE